MGARTGAVVVASLFVGVAMMGCLFFGSNPDAQGPFTDLGLPFITFCGGFLGLLDFVARALSGGSFEGDPNTDKDDTQDQATIRLNGGVTGLRGRALTNDPDLVDIIDTDKDGLPDAWERRHFGDLSRDGSGDFDMDGEPDLAEYVLGSNPTLAPESMPSEGTSGGGGGSDNGASPPGDPPPLTPTSNNCLPRNGPDDPQFALLARELAQAQALSEHEETEITTESEFIQFFELAGITITIDVYRYNRDGEPIFQNTVQATTTEDGTFSLSYEPTPEFGRFRFEVTDIWREDASWAPELDRVEPFDEVVLYF